MIILVTRFDSKRTQQKSRRTELYAYYANAQLFLDVTRFYSYLILYCLFIPNITRAARLKAR